MVIGVGNDIVDYLKRYHREEDNAIKGRDLRIVFNLKDRQLREVVSGLRQHGITICSSSQGYWYSEEPEDIIKTLRRLEGQVINMNNSIKGLKQALQEDKTGCRVEENNF